MVRASFQLKPLSTKLNEAEPNPSVGFECNICLDLVQDPVVTLCGHLFCWPCIYRWISFQDPSSENVDHQSPQCPVCKTQVSENTLIPLYGRGQTTRDSKDKLSHPIPQRPPTPRCLNSLILPTLNRNNSNSFERRGYEAPSPRDQSSYMVSPRHLADPMIGAPSPRDQSSYMASPRHLADPMIGMFGEMVYARIFGNSETTSYSYPNSYYLAGSSSPRMRRHVMQTDKSLSRLCFFFFCCMMLCLLLF